MRTADFGTRSEKTAAPPKKSYLDAFKDGSKNNDKDNTIIIPKSYLAAAREGYEEDEYGDLVVGVQQESAYPGNTDAVFQSFYHPPHAEGVRYESVDRDLRNAQLSHPFVDTTAFNEEYKSEDMYQSFLGQVNGQDLYKNQDTMGLPLVSEALSKTPQENTVPVETSCSDPSFLSMENVNTTSSTSIKMQGECKYVLREDQLDAVAKLEGWQKLEKTHSRAPMATYQRDTIRLSFWLTNGSVGAYLDDAVKGSTQLFRREITMKDMEAIFQTTGSAAPKTGTYPAQRPLIACPSGASCENPSCPYSHYRPRRKSGQRQVCRFGMYCQYPRCKFHHPQQVSTTMIPYSYPQYYYGPPYGDDAMFHRHHHPGAAGSSLS